ncbi:MAG TPA: PDZ domain-containing protein [Candidatus Acidoferrum sp.]|jgi:tricorn protease|nr:PDZ domain-containing protein [Candidatus Acidoferrum sp.]
MRISLRSFFASSFVFLLAPWAALAAADTLPDGFYRYPTIGGGAIVFAAEGDLWKVPVRGGVALRLTAYEGEECFPKISPDGRLIAFTAQYEGNNDVYVMTTSGGEPVRLTFHPAPDEAIGWTSDGKILFRSRRDTPNNDFRIYKISPEGGLPEMIPLEPAAWISFEPNGARCAFQKLGLEFHNWKRYKGGEAEKIYVGSLENDAFKEVTHYDGKNAFPMWAPDGRIYFVTDRWGRPNLASMKPDGSDVKRLTRFEDYDVRWPSMGDGKIVYQHKMDIWVYELATGKNEMVPIQLPSDRLQVREKFVDPKAYLKGWALSKDGERIVLETRGDLFVARTKKKGLIRRLTESSAARTKSPAFSPDGKTVAAWTEVNGEEQLLLHAADNAEPPKQVGTTPPGWHFAPAWSPDGKRLAWGDERYQLKITDVAGGETVVVDHGEWEISHYTWSPDSRYLAYELMQSNLFSQVRVWDEQSKRTFEATEPTYNATFPAWDPKGKYLYFFSDRFINPFLDRFEARFIVNDATLPCVLALQADGRLPFAPRGDTDPEKPKDKKDKEKDDKSKDKDKDSKEKEEKIEPIKIDFDGLMDRFVQVPVPPGNYSELVALEGKLHWLKTPNRGMMPYNEEDPEEDPGGELQTYDIEKEKVSTITSGVKAYAVSLDRTVLVYQTKDGFVRLEAGATAAPKDDEAKEAKLDLSGWSLSINPREEWKQMLHEAWRLQRDFFYDPKMHGVDWEGVWTQYGALADRIGSRGDLADCLGEMFGELNVGHAYHGGGDIRSGKKIGTGLLAADLKYDPATGFWQIQKIYRGDFPMPDWTSPLSRPDLRVKTGQWLVAIDGKPLVKGEDYLKRLANRAGQEVELSVNDTASLSGARRVVVKTVAEDTRVRYADWVRQNREYVDKKSNGQIGYIHLYDMSARGLRQFARDYPPQWRKRGLIMDDRWNHGGFVAPMLLAHLDRKILAIGGTRYGNIDTVPSHAFSGYMACLINRQGGSDCETFALGFKNFKLGPVIGTRTWGGWVGIRGDKPLRDGGMITQPEFGGWDPKGAAWIIEGHGVDPDVELDLNPDGLIHGNDLQLDYAIEHLMKEIAKAPRDLAPAPPIAPRPLRPLR